MGENSALDMIEVGGPHSAGRPEPLRGYLRGVSRMGVRLVNDEGSRSVPSKNWRRCLTVRTAISALTRNQEAYVETVTSDVWQLEQRVTGEHVGDPEDMSVVL